MKAFLNKTLSIVTLVTALVVSSPAIMAAGSTSISDSAQTDTLWSFKDLDVAPEPVDDGTIAGIDVNYNGVRDDVERAITKEFQGKENAKLLQYHMILAQELQKQITQSDNTDQVYESSKRMLRFYECISEEGHDSKKSQLLVLPITLNTWDRVDAWKTAMGKLTAKVIVKELGGCP